MINFGVRRFIAALVLPAFFATGLTGCVNRPAQEQAKKTEAIIKDPSVPVTLVLVSRQTLTETLEITGQLSTTADTSVGAKVAGRLVTVYGQDGSPVRAGQVIAEQESSVPRSQVLQAQAQVSSARAALSQALTNAKVGPQRSAAAVATAQAQLRSAKALLAKAKAGARDEEIAQARSQVNAAKSAMETAKKERDRVQTLFQQGAVSQQRLETAENGYQAALSNYETALEALRMKQNWTRPEDLIAAEEQVRQAEEALRSAQAQQSLDTLLDQQVDQARANLQAAEAALSIARQNLADTQIRSPFNGRIFGQPLQPGTFLSPGTPIARIVGEGGVYFEGEVPETVISRVKPGDTVRVTLDALPGLFASGRVIAISPTSKDVARVFSVRIGMSTIPQGAKPGMFAKGDVVLRTISDAAVVPQRAIVEEGGEKYVFTVSNGRAKRVKVRTGLTNGGLIQVFGVPPGEKIVADGASDLVEGRAVKVEGATEEFPPKEKTAVAPDVLTKEDAVMAKSDSKGE